jgi:fumarate hydratase class II
MVCAQVIGNDAAIAFAGASGNFELNVMMPVMARNLLEQIALLTAAARALGERAITGMSVDVERLRRLAESSPVIATALVPLLGYEAVAALVKDAQERDLTIAEAIAASGWYESGVITGQQVDEALDLQRLTRPPNA